VAVGVRVAVLLGALVIVAVCVAVEVGETVAV
jgi:hypothetical protein